MLNIICALSCEANPIIKALNLKKDMQHKCYQVFYNKEKTINLIITGIGKINAAIATTFIATQHQDKKQSFINIGIAGSAYHEKNKLLLVNKLVDQASSYRYYPKSYFIKQITSDFLYTYDHGVDSLPENGLVDMEASGFYQAAMKFTTQEYIQILKIISDNQASDQKNITKASVEALMNSQIEPIINVINQMKNLLEIDNIEIDITQFTDKIHFTAQQKMQLQRLLERFKAFEKEPLECLDQSKSAKAILHSLEQALEISF